MDECTDKFDARKFDSLIRGKNINFLIGSGASIPLYPTLKLKDVYYSFEDIVSHVDLSEEANAFMFIYYFKKWLEPMSSKFDLSSAKDEKKATFANYKKLIGWMHDFLLHESNEQPKRINIFTTNYDLLFERTFDEFLLEHPLIYFNDGSRGVFTKYISNKNFYLNITHSGYNDNYKKEVPTINLFKIHGSLSWEVCDKKTLGEKRIKVSENNETIQKISNLLEALYLDVSEIENIISECKSEYIAEFIPCLNKKVVTLNLDKNILKSFTDLYSKLTIINPNKYKFSETVLQQHYYQLIRSFSYELERKQAVLIVFGFSFADEHITDIFERSLLNPELLVFIISYSEKGQKELKERFKSYRNIKFLPERFEEINGSKLKGDFNYLIYLLGGKCE